MARRLYSSSRDGTEISHLEASGRFAPARAELGNYACNVHFAHPTSQVRENVRSTVLTSKEQSLMQIVIPMSGFGERFRRVGYAVPKFLIEVEGKPIIAHVIDLFPGETDFLFICNEQHLADPGFAMRDTLARFCPSGKVVAIAPHQLGPVHAVLQVAALIKPDEPTVVNYCDFACIWDWPHFKRFVVDSGCDGAIPAYRGFHPHSLGTTNYAYMRETDGWVDDIQEKQPFTANRITEYASSGTYYFSTGQLMLDAFADAKAGNHLVGGEYYVSLAYKPLLASGHRIAVYPLQHFMQWGTPEDVREYRVWSDTFRRLIDPRYVVRPRSDGVNLIPMAGLGERFSREGYETTKPLIPVSGKPMVLQAAGDLPTAHHNRFVLRRDMPDVDTTLETLRAAFPIVSTVILDRATDGQARTALLGWQSDPKLADLPGPLTVGACDNGALYRAEAFEELLADQSVDVIVWVARGYPNAARHPKMYGWVKCDGDVVTGVSIKAPLSDPATDPIITGTFTFRRGSDFECAVERLIAREGAVNGEYYLDSCIEDALALELSVRAFEIDSYLCWGTPNDLRTFEYWQSCFHKWSSHPYRVELDQRVAANAVPFLTRSFFIPVPDLPESKPLRRALA